MVHRDNTLPPAQPVRTQLVPATTSSADNQNFKTVTVTLLNEDEAYPEVIVDAMYLFGVICLMRKTIAKIITQFATLGAESYL